MSFSRTWDSEFPRVWSSWEADGKKWVIQDLRPEDNEEALRILMDDLCAEELLCSYSNVTSDPESMRTVGDIWRQILSGRTVIACYCEENGGRRLAGLNACFVHRKGESLEEVGGEAWKNVIGAVTHINKKIDVYEYLGVDELLHALGLMVLKPFRGARLGAKLLEAREPLCRHIGIAATASLFSEGGRKSALQAGFTPISSTSLAELLDAGLKYPRDESKFVELMVKKYK